MTDTGAIPGDEPTDIAEVVADIFPNTVAHLYRSRVLDRELPVFTVCPADSLPILISPPQTSGTGANCDGREDSEGGQFDIVSGNQRSSNSPIDDVHTSVRDLCTEFTAVDQYFYQAIRLEADVALFDLSQGKPQFVDSSPPPTMDKEPSKNAERRRKQRERQKERKKMGVPSKSPTPVEPNPPPAKPKTKEDKCLKGGNKEKIIKKPTVVIAPTKEGKSEEGRGRKSPKLTPDPTGSGRKSPRLSITENPTEESSKFERDFIFPLKKKSLKFPKAKYFCRLCDYHCDDTHHINRHVKDNRHQALKKVKVQDVLLIRLPPPTPVHTDVISKLLEQVTSEHALSQSNLDDRDSVLQRLRSLVSKHFKDVKLNMYGSSVSGFGLRGVSDLNIELTAEKAPPVLKELYTILKADKSGYFTRIQSDFSDIVPSILCFVPSTKHFVQIGIPGSGTTSGSSWLVSELLHTYCQIDPRVRLLGVPFRRWARLCGVDKQEDGTLPAYAFSLLTVFFLQQCQPPVLPVLHEVGSLEDRQGGAQSNLYFNDLQNLSKFWTTHNTDSVGSLWIQMCRFYAVDFDIRENVICIRQLEALGRGDKKWTRRLPIEDPFQRKRNIARSISHVQVFDYISEQLRNLYQYFGIPQTPSGPLYKDIDINILEKELLQSMRERSPRKSPRLSPTPGEQNSESNSTLAPARTSASQELLGDSDDEGDDGPKSNVHNVYSLAASIAKSALCEGMRESVGDLRTPKNVSRTSHKVSLFNQELAKSLQSEDLHFVFSKDVFCREKGPPRICALCHKQSHLQQDCPDVKLPPLTPLPPLNKKYRTMLDAILLKVPGDFEPTQLETNLRNNLRGSLEQYIRSLYRDARLYLFGSSCNGFGFSHSDMDICMVLENTDSSSVDYVEVISALAKHLRKHTSLQNVFAITTAKVPIVKFKHKHSGLDGDISLYNTLAVHNTRMLEMYCKLDYRVRALGYTMKVFAKLCDICDASKGSLSSYAYILMVIYFLQQRSPPVIPVLQELHNGQKPVREVDGWNAWFYDDLSSLPTIWKDFGKNKESLGELWIGLLRFYTEEFSYKDCVISIRQGELLTRFEKLWNGKCVTIEDPFDQSHNLGGGLSRKMDNYIMKAFHNGRALFGRNVLDVPRGYSTLEDYLFDPKLLTETAPPNDRNCRICNKIGHWAKECPSGVSRKEGKQAERTREQGQMGNENRSSSLSNRNEKNGGKVAQNKESGAISKKGTSHGVENITSVSTVAKSGEKKSNVKQGGKSEDSRAKVAVKKVPVKEAKEALSKGKQTQVNESTKERNSSDKDAVKRKQDNKQQANLKGHQNDKSNKRKLDGAPTQVSSVPVAVGGKDGMLEDAKSQKQKARVFYNKQRASGPSVLPHSGLLPTPPGLLPTPDQHYPEPLKVTPRAVYINHASSVQISQPGVSAPVQQFFRTYSDPKQQQPYPLMDLRFPEAPMAGQHGFNQSQFGPMNTGYHDNGGGLTWQQTTMLQEPQVSQSTRSRGRRVKSESSEGEYPMLEVTVPNDNFTWQQQQLYLQKKNQSKKGPGRSRKPRPSKPTNHENRADNHMINEQD